MKTPDVNWAASDALFYGPAVTVLAPEEVRRTVQAWAQTTAELYLDPEAGVETFKILTSKGYDHDNA